ncbi:elongation factor tu gtp binding domain-containing protein [Cystoisospora suis]|uniref:Elongation factor tu gtp binding domain-containing protein n=1 Tax=Cystoisospora suis TaxID=483139 RepID=A0A2C6KML3_9APIC|nr:elongation factor tu gtp binding domain-containing protein [Cystoisospora suis]
MEGRVSVGDRAQIYRDKQLLGEGFVVSLRIKSASQEVVSGVHTECGVMISNFSQDYQLGDLLLFFPRDRSVSSSSSSEHKLQKQKEKAI